MCKLMRVRVCVWRVFVFLSSFAVDAAAAANSSTLNFCGNGVQGQRDDCQPLMDCPGVNIVVVLLVGVSI